MTPISSKPNCLHKNLRQINLSIPVKETIIRSLTGIALIALIVLSLVIHPVGYLLLFGIACILSWIEFAKMYKGDIQPVVRTTVAIYLSASFLLAFFVASDTLLSQWLLIPVTILLFLPLAFRLIIPSVKMYRIWLITLATIYLLTGFSSLHFIAYPGGSEGYSPKWILFTFYFLWIYDSMAYVSGRLAGKHPVWPSVSPGKTWEGSIGGALFTIGLAILFSHYFPYISTWEWVGFAGIIIAFGSLGDFFESWLKRIAGVKDSGQILPGHGGVLDRLDSLLLSVPFITLYLNIIL